MFCPVFLALSGCDKKKSPPPKDIKPDSLPRVQTKTKEVESEVKSTFQNDLDSSATTKGLKVKQVSLLRHGEKYTGFIVITERDGSETELQIMVKELNGKLSWETKPLQAHASGHSPPTKETEPEKHERFLWKFSSISSYGAIHSPSMAKDGTVYIGSSSGKVHALDGKTGKQIWEFETVSDVKSAPAIGADGTVYVATSDNVFALDGKTGAKKWKFESGSGFHEGFTAPAIDVKGTLYVGSTDKKLYALNSKTGVKVWEFESGNRIVSSPSVGMNGTVYFVSGLTEVFALSGNTGEKVWKIELGRAKKFFAFPTKSSSPAIGADGSIFVGGPDGKMYALNGKTGSKIWEYETGWAIFGAPSIGPDGVVYIASGDSKLYALNEKTGAKKWGFDLGNSAHTAPAIGAEGTVYIGSRGSGQLFALDGKTGTKKWEFDTGTWPQIRDLSPCLGNDGVILYGIGKTLFALQTDSKGPAKSPWPMRVQNAQHTGRAP